MLRKIWTVIAVVMAFAVVTASGSTGAKAQTSNTTAITLLAIVQNPGAYADPAASMAAILATAPDAAALVQACLTTTAAMNTGNGVSLTTFAATTLAAVAKSNPALAGSIGGGMGSAQKTLTNAGVQSSAALAITAAAGTVTTQNFVTAFNSNAAVPLPNPNQTATNQGSPG